MSSEYDVTTIQDDYDGGIYISDGDKFEKYYAYIHDGEQWVRYIPYIYEDGEWKMCEA